MPTFTVVICTHNRARRVSRAINSVLGQTFDDFELVVVDDGSVDDTPSVVAAIDDERLTYMYRDNGGLSAARNTGVGASCGRYVTFLDDDDEAFPRWLEKFHETLGGRDAVVTCGALGMYEQGHAFRILLPQTFASGFEEYCALFQAGAFAMPRTVYEAIGGFAEDLRTRHHAEFALRLLPYCRSHACPVEVIEEPLLRLEIRASEHRVQNMPTNVLSATDYLLAQHENELERSPAMLANTLAMAGVAAARLGRYADARRFFARAARTHPTRVMHFLRLMLAFVPPLGDRVWNARFYRRMDHQAPFTPTKLS